jgi:hypothetical protein
MANANKTAKDTAKTTQTPAEGEQSAPVNGSEAALQATTDTPQATFAPDAAESTPAAGDGEGVADTPDAAGTVAVLDNAGDIPQFATLEQLAAISQRLDTLAGAAADDTAVATTGETFTHTVQAVAVPSGRRMRAGRVFTTEETPVNRADFSGTEWAALENDPHIKLKTYRG